MPTKPKSYLIFVYGTLKRGYGNNTLLKTAEFIGEATTCEPYRMFHVGFPVLLADLPPGKLAGKVRGEIFKVNEIILNRLDGLESEGRMYQRLPISVTTASGELQEVLAYIGIQAFWHNRGIANYGKPVIPTEGLLTWDDAR